MGVQNSKNVPKNFIFLNLHISNRSVLIGFPAASEAPPPFPSLSSSSSSTSNSGAHLRYLREIEVWILRLLSAPVPVPGEAGRQEPIRGSFRFCGAKFNSK